MGEPNDDFRFVIDLGGGPMKVLAEVPAKPDPSFKLVAMNSVDSATNAPLTRSPSRPPTATGLDGARTNSVAAFIAQGHVRPVFLSFSHANRLRQQIWFHYQWRGISQFV